MQLRTVAAHAVTRGDVLVEFHGDTNKVKSTTKVTAVDRGVCMHHVHLNNGCYDWDAPVTVTSD